MKRKAITSAQAHHEPETPQLNREDFEALIARAEAAERALHESRMYSRTLMENAADAIFVVAADTGLVVDCNRKAEELLGLPREQLIGRHQTELHPPEQAQHYASLFERIAADGHGQTIDGQVICRGGAIRDVEITVFLQRENGMQLVQGIFRDVTNARKARGREELLSEALSRSLNGFDIVSQDMRFLYANPAYLKMWGFDSEAEVVGTSPAPHCVDPDMPRRIIETLRRDGHGRFEFEARRKDGSTFDLLLDAFLWKDATGKEFYAGTTLDISREKKVLARLRESEARYRHFVENFQGIAFQMRCDCEELIFLHGKVEEITGYTVEDYLSKRLRWTDIVHPDDLPLFFNARQRLLDASKRLTDIEYRIIHQSGQIRWLRGVSELSCSASGEPEIVQGTVYDITERKKAILELAESQRELSNLLGNLPGVAYRCLNDENWTPLFLSDGVHEITGYTAEELIDKRHISFRAMIYPDDLVNVRQQIEEALAKHEPYELSYRIRDAAGRTRWLLARGRAAYGDERQVLFIEGFVWDVTERKLAELELHERQRELSTLMSNLPGMAYRCENDEDWSMVFVSDGVRDVTGYAPEDLIENHRISYAQLIHEDDAEEVRRLVDLALERREHFELSYRIHDAEGNVRWLWERGQGVFGVDGQLKFLEGFVLDVSRHYRAEEERDKLKDQLRQAQKMEAVGQLAGGVAHDFNNILTAIFGNIELAITELGTSLPNINRVSDRLHQIEKGANRAAALTRQLLAFGRRQVIRPEVVDINAVLHDLEKMLARLIPEAIAMEFRCAAELRPVKVDPGQLEQVIINLVVNARDAMLGGGRLLFETHNVFLDEAYVSTHPDASVGPHVQLSVSDTGCGMDAATRDRLFEPFFTTKPIGQGTGLGLATVYGILKQSSGSVAVYSETGLGTTFKIYLPVSDHDATVHEQVHVEGAAPTGIESIIVCEDDPAVRDLTTLLLKDAGYAVLTAATPSDALQLTREHPKPIDLLLTDVIMPEMNGRKLSDAVHALRPDVRTLFVSGYSADVIAYHGVLKEDVDLLEKPYSRRQLLIAVRQVLDAVKSH